jgi:hypothetical protein
MRAFNQKQAEESKTTARAAANKRPLLQFLGDRFGNQLKLEHDVVFHVEAGGVHGAQRIALEPLGVFG